MPKDTLDDHGGDTRRFDRFLPGELAVEVPSALIRPARRGKGYAVVDARGAPVTDALTFRKYDVVYSDFVDRQTEAGAERLAGRWLFAGDYWPHFGHFMFESLSRLWWLDQTDHQPDGIVFNDTRRHGGTDIGAIGQNFLRLMGIDLPVRLIAVPTEVECLVVPRQGSGLGAMAAGTPAHRQFMRNRLSRIEPRRDAPLLYLSRLGYRMRRGGHLDEGWLQRNLAAQGYTIFMPEKFSIEDQIASYLGAEKIVAPDSSALHLVGFLGRPELDLAIVLRREAGARDLLPQITGHCGRLPLVIDSMRRVWTNEAEPNQSWGTFAELDHAHLGQALKAAGFLPDPGAWRLPKDWQADHMREVAFRLIGRELAPGPDRQGTPSPQPVTEPVSIAAA